MSEGEIRGAGEVLSDDEVTKIGEDPVGKNARACAVAEGCVNPEADGCTKHDGAVAYEDVLIRQDAMQEISKVRDVPVPTDAARPSADHRY
jgi:hypothetical protein